MAQWDRIRVGLVGYGVGKLYAAAFRNAGLYYSGFPEIDLVSIATATQESGEKAKKQFGFQRCTTDYGELLEAEDINVLVIATPNHLHRTMLVGALQTDKAIYADKPLTNTYDEALEVFELAQSLGRDAQVIFEFRFCPALQKAHTLIEQDRIGEIYACRLSYFRSSYVSPQKTLGWKGSFDQSGGGVMNDYLPHLIDLLIWLVGVPQDVTAVTRTFIDKRPQSKGSSQQVSIDTDDHAIILCELPGGAIGTIEAGRMITGATNDMCVEVFGSKGSLKWNLMDTNYLYFAENAPPKDEEGWMKIPTIQDYPGAVIPGADVPVGMMRFHIASVANFLKNTIDGKKYDPGITQGLRVQAVIESALDSVKGRTWRKLPQE
jgi:predicted dehydrogenase